MQTALGISERRACRTIGQPRSTQRKLPRVRGDEAALTTDIVALATKYGRYGYRRVTALLRRDGWLVNAKRVQRIWRREGLKVPQRQPKRGRLWLNDVNAGLKMHQSAGLKMHHLRPREGPRGGLLSGGLILWVWRGRRVPVQRSGGASWID